MSLIVYTDGGKTQLSCPKGALSRVCVVPAGATFSVDIKTGPAPASGFQGYQIVLQYTGLSFVNQNGLAENRWPPCPSAGSELNQAPTLTRPGRYTLLCKAGPPPRTYKGVLANVHFSCGQGTGGQIDIIGGGGAAVSFYERPSIYGNRIFLVADPKARKNVADAVRIQCGVRGQGAGIAVDSDGDGCADKQERSRLAQFGGQRDLLNPWDFFDPNFDQRHRIDDLVAVVTRVGLGEGVAGYSADYDRTFLGPNFWDLGPPDGRIDLQDAFQQASLYRHDCA